jgi:hypothetical protein
MIHSGQGTKPPVRADGARGDTAMWAYHAGEKLHCQNCHVMHASYEGQGYNGPADSPAGYPHLLKAASSMELCLSCHDGQVGIPDVVGADTNGLTERSAGMFATPNTANPNGHKLGPGARDLCLRCHFRPRGDTTDPEATCTDCHNPHGNGVARNLQWASYPKGTPPLGLFVDPSATGLDKYERENIAYGTDGTEELREVTNMCIDCHHTISAPWHVDEDGDGIPNKHPVTETEWGATIRVSDGDPPKGTTDSAHWTGGSGAGFDIPRVRFVNVSATSTSYSAAKTVSANNAVFCLSCHKAHGSEHPDGLVWPREGGAVGPDGCNQCHNKGAS